MRRGDALDWARGPSTGPAAGRARRRPPPDQGAFNTWEKTMNSKILASAVVVAAAVLAFWGCAGKPLDASSGRPFDCTSNTCEVSVGNFMLGEVDVPEVIQVNASSSGTVVTVTWSLTSPWGVTFNPQGGIFMKDPKSPFKCEAVNAKQWKCTGTGLQPRTQYRYGLKFSGTWRPYDIDPYIQN
jgi:hypothetical protein